MQQRQSTYRRLAAGFTLLEVLVVVGIIALLASITFAVVGNILATAKESATEATILKISGLLNQQISGFERQYNPDTNEFKALAGRYRSGTYFLTADRDTSEVFAKKAAYTRAFPQNVYEASGFDRTPGTADDIELYVDWITNNTESAADSSELLFLAMTKGKIRGVTPVDRDAFSSSELGDTDNDEQLEFLDAWGQPLRFYRWPTRLYNPFGFVANQLASAITIAQTSVDLDNAGPFSSLPTPFKVVVGREIMEVTNVSGNTLTVIRGSDPQAHQAATLVRLAPYSEIAFVMLGGLNTSVLSHDADDRLGAVMRRTGGGGFANILDLGGAPFPGGPIEDYELLFHTLDSYHVPLIVSAGADGETGLVEPGPTGGTGTDEPMNFWLPGTATTIDDWRWGGLAQPDTNDGDAGVLATLVTDPGSTPLADNITNHTAGSSN